MTPTPRRNLALFIFGAAAILSACSREDASTATATDTPAPHQTGPLTKAPDAPAADTAS
ncbi:MAG: hypothetical protein INR68_19305 [Methylobacterium mesophilicum]|nr:hypothetical protein [Methylobacterium mesophilicum]